MGARWDDISVPSGVGGGVSVRLPMAAGLCTVAGGTEHAVQCAMAYGEDAGWLVDMHVAIDQRGSPLPLCSNIKEDARVWGFCQA